MLKTSGRETLNVNDDQQREEADEGDSYFESFFSMLLFLEHLVIVVPVFSKPAAGVALMLACFILCFLPRPQTTPISEATSQGEHKLSAAVVVLVGVNKRAANERPGNRATLCPASLLLRL